LVYQEIQAKLTPVQDSRLRPYRSRKNMTQFGAQRNIGHEGDFSGM
jgi:hypothetical protein